MMLKNGIAAGSQAEETSGAKNEDSSGGYGTIHSSSWSS